MIAVKRRKRLPVSVATVPGLFVSYRRTSTGRQTLGVESQAEIIGRHVAANGGTIAADFVEHASAGGDTHRPELAAALEKCREIGATLICAKLDRLSRDVEFISGLLKHSVPILTCDYPSAPTLQLHIVAAMAQDERRQIGERTRNALSVLKQRGAPLGAQLRTATGERVADVANAAKARKADANACAALAEIQSVITEAGEEGVSLRAIARTLNERTATADGYAWSAATVSRAIRRAFGEQGLPASL